MEASFPETGIMLRSAVSRSYNRLSGCLRSARIASPPTVFKLLSRFVRFGGLPISTIPILYGLSRSSKLSRLSSAPVVSAKESEDLTVITPSLSSSTQPSSASPPSSPPTSASPPSSSPPSSPHSSTSPRSSFSPRSSSSPHSSSSPSSSSPRSSSSPSAKTAEDSILRKKKSRLIDLVDAHNSRDDHLAVKRILTEFRAEETDDPRLLWRYSRALYELSMTSSSGIDDSTTSMSSRDSLLEAFRLANGAVDAAAAAAAAAKDIPTTNNDGAAEAHLWYAIVLEALGKWKSLRERISDAFVVKDHYLKSLQLKPQSAIVLHCLGSWCYTIASVNWFERKLAQFTSQDLPVSTYEEALGYFRAAEEVSPNFYSHNLLLIAKCYIQLKNEVKADEYLERVVNFAPLRSKEDENAVKEAQRLRLLED